MAFETFDTEGFRQLLEDGLSIKPSTEALNRFRIYYDFLLEFNSHTNLTRIEPSSVSLLHFYDSLTLVKFLDLSKISNLLDIGSGAGFPGIPLKIIFPHLSITLLDSKQKKVRFLKELLSRVSLKQAEAVHGRAEDLAKTTEYKNKFELVTARAVADAGKLVGIMAPFKKPQGSLVLYKGPKGEAELNRAGEILKKLKLEVGGLHKFSLSKANAERTIIICK